MKVIELMTSCGNQLKKELMLECRDVMGVDSFRINHYILGFQKLYVIHKSIVELSIGDVSV